MHIEFLVEEPSTEVALNFLVPKIIGDIHAFKIHNFQNKDRLLKRLPQRMKSYVNSVRDDWRIVIIVDQDRDNCQFSPHMNIENNLSKSFQVFRDGLRSIVN